MRVRAFGSLLLGISIFATGCNRDTVTREEAESILAKTASNRSRTAHFTCEEGQRDWLYICRVRYEPTPIGIREGGKPTTVERAGITRMGTYQGKPLLSYRTLPDQGPVMSQAEQESWQKDVVMVQRKAEADAYAAKVKARADRAVGK
jgi:hypothetical protein